MPYYLNNASTVNAFVGVNALTLSNVGDYIEFKGFTNSGVQGWLGSTGTTHSLEVSDNKMEARFNGNFVAAFLNPVISVGVDFTIRVEKVGADLWRYFQNGVQRKEFTEANNIIFSEFFTLDSGAFNSSMIGALYYVEASTDGTGVATNRWENTTGTGSTWTDTIGANDGTLFNFPTDDSQWVAYGVVTPIIRKSSTFDIETALGTITTATLNSVNVFDHVTGQVGTTVSFAGAATDEITTSGEYTLTLGDGATTEDITVQVNVVGLTSFNINKDGADQGSLSDVEFIILTGAAGSRAINQQITGITTTAGGDTGAIEITDTALNDGDTVMIAQRSDAVSGGGGAFHPATLELI